MRSHGEVPEKPIKVYKTFDRNFWRAGNLPSAVEVQTQALLKFAMNHVRHYYPDFPFPEPYLMPTAQELAEATIPERIGESAEL